MRTIRLALALLLPTFFAPRSLFAADAGHATISAILIIASNDPGPTDSRLAPYEANLKGTLRYASFRYVGEGSASVAGGGAATVALPNNNRLELQAEKSDGRGVRVKVHFGSTDVVIPPGKTVILVGRPAGAKGEVSAVIVTAN